MKENSSQIEIKNTLTCLVLTVVVWSIIPVTMFLGRHIDTQIRNETLIILDYSDKRDNPLTAPFKIVD